MSWQATAYVKTLRAVTVYEKLLLFVLADYHNTHDEAAYPSVPRLADEALMKERYCYELLKGLEQPRPGHPGGILSRRRSKSGRGERTEYVFVELQKDAHSAVIEKVNTAPKRENGARKAPKGCTETPRNKERVDGVDGVDDSSCLKCGGKGTWQHRGHPGVQIYCWCPAGLELQRLDGSMVRVGGN